MKTIYFDCFAGAAGDMLLGALLDVGLDFSALEGELRKLSIADYAISTRRLVKQNVTSQKFDVTLTKKTQYQHHGRMHSTTPHGRSYARIREILESASIPNVPKNRAVSAFHRLGVVEARIHGVDIESVHFHEVGAVDSIIDITGYFLGLHMLGIERVVSSPLPVGRGYVECAHGRMPIPAPATAKLLEGVPVMDNGLKGEVLTPTGALLLSESAESFGPIPEMKITKVGYGAGEKDQKNMPNVVRALLGESQPSRNDNHPPAIIAVLETNIDDMSPEFFPYLIKGALKAGALDAFSTPIVGKKGRPAQLFTILSPVSKKEALTRFVFQETSTLGVRHRTMHRSIAERQWMNVTLPWGQVRVKKGTFEGKLINLAPEYEDCKRLAEENGVPLKQVMEAAASRARETQGSRS